MSGLEPAEAEAAGAPPAASVEPLGAVYIAQHRILHNNHEYKTGDVFAATTAEDLAVAQDLRAKGALKLETEVRDAADLANDMARMQAQIAKLTAERDALAAAAAQRSARSR